jgi:hypothetical protein
MAMFGKGFARGFRQFGKGLQRGAGSFSKVTTGLAGMGAAMLPFVPAAAPVVAGLGAAAGVTRGLSEIGGAMADA